MFKFTIYILKAWFIYILFKNKDFIEKTDKLPYLYYTLNATVVMWHYLLKFNTFDVPYVDKISRG